MQKTHKAQNKTQNTLNIYKKHMMSNIYVKIRQNTHNQTIIIDKKMQFNTNQAKNIENLRKSQK